MNIKKRLKNELHVLFTVTILLVSIFVSSVSAYSYNVVHTIKKMPARFDITNKNGEILWDNGDPGIMVIASQLDSTIPFNAQAADDFIFEEDTDIYGIGWYGGFWNGPASDISDFTIYVYADNGSGNAPTGGGTEHPEITALETYHFEDVVGEEIVAFSYKYEVDLDPPFLAQQDIKYWMVIQMIVDFPPQWGWYETYNNQVQLSPAVQGFLYMDMPFWAETGHGDLAFYLSGQDDTPQPPQLEIADISGGTTLHVVINNIGEIDATEVIITIVIDKGLYIVPRDFTQTNEIISVGTSHGVDLRVFGFGLGRFTDQPLISVTVTASNMESIHKSINAKIVLYFVMIN